MSTRGREPQAPRLWWATRLTPLLGVLLVACPVLPASTRATRAAVHAQEHAQAGSGQPVLHMTPVPGEYLTTVTVDTRAGHVFIGNLGSGNDQNVGLGSVAMLDAASGRFVRTTTVGPYPHAAILSAATGRLFVLNWGPGSTYGGQVPTTPGSISVLDTATGLLVDTVPLAVSPLTAVVAPREGRVFVTATPGAVLVLDTRDGRLLRTLRLGGALKAPAVDERTGHVFVVVDQPTKYEDEFTDSSPRSVVAMLDARTGAVLHQVTVRGGALRPAVDTQTGRVFVAHDGGKAVTMLDARSGSVLRVVTLPEVAWPAVVDEADGRVFVPSRAGVKTLDARTGRLLATAPAYGYDAVLAQRAGRLFLRGVGGIDVVDARTGAFVRTLYLGQGMKHPVVDEAAGRVLVTNDGRQELNVLDARTGAVIARFPLPSGPASTAMDPAIGRAFVALRSAVVAFLDPATIALPPGTITVGYEPRAVAILERTHRAFVLNNGGYPGRDDPARDSLGSVTVLDTASGVVLRHVLVGSRPVALLADAITNRIFTLTESPNCAVPRALLSVLDGTSGVLLATRVLSGTASLLGVLAGGGEVVTLRESCAGEVQQALVLDGHSGAVRRVFSPLPPVLGTTALLPALGRLAINPVGSTVGDTLSLFATATSALVAHVGLGAGCGYDTLIPAEQLGRLYIFCLYPGRLIALDARTGRILRTVAVPSSTVRIAVDQQAGHLLVAIDEGYYVGATFIARVSVALYDARTLRRLTSAPIGALPSSLMVVSGAARALALSGRTVTTLDTRTGTALATITTTVSSRGYVYEPSMVASIRLGRVYLRSQVAATVDVLDLSSGALLSQLPVGVPDPSGCCQLPLLALDRHTGYLFSVNTLGDSVTMVPTAASPAAAGSPVGAVMRRTRRRSSCETTGRSSEAVG